MLPDADRTRRGCRSKNSAPSYVGSWHIADLPGSPGDGPFIEAFRTFAAESRPEIGCTLGSTDNAGCVPPQPNKTPSIQWVGGVLLSALHPRQAPLEALWKQPGEQMGVVTLQRMANVRHPMSAHRPSGLNVGSAPLSRRSAERC